RVFAGVVEAALQLEQRLRPEGVSHLGAIDGDLRDSAPLFVDDVLELLDQFPFHGSAPRNASGVSRCGAWPAPSMSRSSECGRRPCMRRAMAANFSSRAPAISVTGTCRFGRSAQ